MKGSFKTRIATSDDINVIIEVTNDAFMADAFFKKSEYHQRFTREDVEYMIANQNSQFILAENSDTATIVGSIYLHWEFHPEKDEVLLIFML